MADSQFKIQGLEAVQKKLKNLSQQMEKKAVRAAGTRAMRIVRDAAREGARALDDPRSGEKIFKNIVTKAGKSKNKGEIRVRVGVMGGARNMQAYGEFRGAGSGNPGGDTWYWRLLEFGTSSIPARPFMRPALERNQEKVAIEFTDYLGKQIDKIVATGR